MLNLGQVRLSKGPAGAINRKNILSPTNPRSCILSESAPDPILVSNFLNIPLINEYLLYNSFEHPSIIHKYKSDLLSYRTGL